MKPFTPKAFLFDLNGTMVDDMRFHLEVWHAILNQDLKARLTLEEVRSHMYGKNHELLERVFGNGKFTREESDKISRAKEDRYQDLYRPHMKLLPGLQELLQKAAERRVKMAIGSAAIPYNIDFVLDTLNIRHFFQAIVSADDVLNSKPDPETYLRAAEQLSVSPSECLVFEDAPKGVEAAQRAGMPAIAITTMHSPDEFSYLSNILMFAEDYNDPHFSLLFNTSIPV
jgi:beta-phosphoglucomutase